MKRLICIMLCAVLCTFYIVGCATEEVSEAYAPEAEQETETITSEVTETEPEEEALPAVGFTPLELIGYYIEKCEHTGYDRIYIDNEGWEPIDDPAVIREYFFATWVSPSGRMFAIDDTKENSGHYWSYACWHEYYDSGFYKIGDVLISAQWDMAGPNSYYWIDMNNPDILYIQTDWAILEEDYETWFVERTDLPSPITDVDESFITWFREWEITLKYGIEPELLTSVEYYYEKGERTLNRDWRWLYSNLYLISEADDMLVFSTLLDDCVGMSPTYTATAIVTLEKKNGEWIRTIDVSEINRNELIDGEWVWFVEILED